MNNNVFSTVLVLSASMHHLSRSHPQQEESDRTVWTQFMTEHTKLL